MPPPPSSDTPLTRGASTTVVNPAETAPFSVTIHVPDRFDPSANNFNNKLRVTYDVVDPNERIRSGRILYQAITENGEVVVKRTLLSAEHWTPGSHTLPEPMQWNGQIDEGIADRRNEFMTADLAPFAVRIELWNTGESEPAARVRGGGGRTERSGEWCASSTAAVEIDFVVEARWERHWCVPWQDPGEYADSGDEGKGQVGMILRVKNVRENTPVLLQVMRIGHPVDVSGDLPYRSSGEDPDEQPGLENLIVQNHRVFSPDSGGDPYVRFSNYDEHWTHPGNNFYFFLAAFGPGAFMRASERDYVNHERACLHMRFTVFIHCPPSDEFVAPAQQLHSFFRGTRYYRSYFLRGKPSDATNYIYRTRRRYITVHMGHGAASCLHWDHPRTLIPNTGVGFATPDTTPVATVASLTLVKRNKVTAEVTNETIDISTPERNNVNAVVDALNAIDGVHAQAMASTGRNPLSFINAVPADANFTLRLSDGTRNIMAFTNPRDPYHMRFDPEGYCCPVSLMSNLQGNPIPGHLREHGGPGCGNSSHVILQASLGRRGRTRMVFSNMPSPTVGRDVVWIIEGTTPTSYTIRDNYCPRFIMFNGGCRGMMSTAFGEIFTGHGSSYYSGWVYSVLIYDGGIFVNQLFRRYVASDSSECLIDNFADIYNRLRQRGQFTRWHPRLYGSGGVVPIAAAPVGPGEALA